jgi:hypothetical protein
MQKKRNARERDEAGAIAAARLPAFFHGDRPDAR